MLILPLHRRERGDHGTFGRLSLPRPESPGAGLWIAEPPPRDNLTGLSCIPGAPRGLGYLCVWQRSPKYGWCYEVTEVRGRTRILMHSGNLAGDSTLDMKTHTKGCLLPGMRLGYLTVRGIRQRAVLNSRTAVRRLAEHTGKAPFILRIYDPAPSVSASKRGALFYSFG